MDIIGIFILVAMILILYQLTKPNKIDPFNGEIRRPTRNTDMINEAVIDDVVSWDSRMSNNDSVVTKAFVNPNFINNQFHNDYRDVITAINNIVPQKKQLFNLANIPVKYSEPEDREVTVLVKDFTDVLNKNLRSHVPDVRNKNSGWDEAIPEPTVKSGWETIQESLGLTASLWDKPSSRSQLKLIGVSSVQKYETEDEIKFSCEIILQKVNVDDQMILKVSFVQDKTPLHNENNFFVTKNIEMKITIEDVYIKGYLSKEGNDARLIFDSSAENYFNYDQMERNDMTDPKFIQKTLMDKYKQRTLEMQQRNAMLDEEGQAFHKDLPHMYDFSNIIGTRTIFDDMNTKKRFY